MPSLQSFARERAARPGRASRSLRPGLEPLEIRAMLSTAPAATPAAEASARENRAYVEALVGTHRPLSPRESALRDRLVAQLDRGLTRERVTLNLLRSTPALAVQVRSAYRGLLHRDPSPRELDAGIGRLRRGGDERSLEAALAGSLEYYRSRGGGTDAGFVDALYGDVLRRDPSPAERDESIRALGGPVSRTALARRLMQSPEARASLIRATKAGGPGTSTTPTALDYRDLSRPGGVARIAARSLAAEPAFRQIISPAWPLLPSAADSAPPQPPGFPSATGFDLNSVVRRLNLTNEFLDLQTTSISVGTDDVPWFATTTGLLTYGLNTGTLTQAFPTGDNPPTRVAAVSALSANEAYFLASLQGTSTPTSIVHIVGGVTTPLPGLPGNEQPTQVSAAPDGTLWVLAQSGGLYSYQATTAAWDPVATGGFSLKEISVGSAANIRALTGAGQVLDYSAQGGFQADPYFGTSQVDAIRATSDGAAWAYASGLAFMKPDYGVWKLLPVQSNLGTSPFIGPNLAFSAGSMNRAFVLGTTASGDFGVDMLSLGVVDRQPVPLPVYQGDELAAYTFLSLAATQQQNPNIRSLYDQTGQTWSSFKQGVDHAKKPASISQAAWTRVQSELSSELQDLGSVYGRLGSLETINGQIQSINKTQLETVGGVVGLYVNNQFVQGTASLILTDVFEAVLGAISSTGISPAFATMAALLSSGVGDAIAAFQQQNNVGPDDAVPIELSKLYETINGIFKSSIETMNSDLQVVSTDRGKLRAVADKILSNAWPMSDDDVNAAINSATNAFTLYSYQVLIASRWKVVGTTYLDYIKYPISQILVGVPTDAYVVYPDGFELGVPRGMVFLINGLEGGTDFNDPVGLSPFPNSALLKGVASLGQSQVNDFWYGRGGWSVIKRVPATLS